VEKNRGSLYDSRFIKRPMTNDSSSPDKTAERIARVEELIKAVEHGDLTVGEGKEALAEARQLIETMQSEFD